MRRTATIIFGALLLFGITNVSAKEAPAKISKPKQKTLNVLSVKHSEVLDFARELMALGKLDDAQKALLAKPYQNHELEIERLYLLAQIATLQHKYDEAIDIYYLILNYRPDISNIRFRLADLYLRKEAWLRADYHYRLTLADKNLPAPVEHKIKNALQYIRKHKNWNFWLNFAIAPDNNVNNTASGEQCVMTQFGILCNTLDKPERDVGLNLTAGGHYEFKLAERWRLRNEAMIYTARYDDKKYDDVYLYDALGPRYIHEHGDIFLGATATRRYLGHKVYNYSAGVKLETNYDLTKQLTTNLEFHYSPTYYDDYDKILNGDVKGGRLRLFYALNATQYLIFKTGYEYEKTKDRAYTNNRTNYAIGFGAELPYGFHMYAEPSILFTRYKGARWTVKDYQFEQIRERDITRRYAISISNRNISFWDIVPTLTYSYTDKSSNIWQREYKKSLIELSLQKRF